MAAWESSDLLSQFNARVGRPTTDAIKDVQKYARLSRAQNRVVALMMGVCPDSLYPKVGYSSLPTLTTTDNQVYTFGTDAAAFPLFPMGKGGIYASLNDIPNFPLRPGIDYMVEGYQIRIPNNSTHSGTLYWYGVGQPADITASVQPSLFPEASRELIVIECARQFAQEYLRNAALADEMKAEFFGDPANGLPGAWPVWCQVWRSQYRDGGALNVYTGRQLALAGSANLGGW